MKRCCRKILRCAAALCILSVLAAAVATAQRLPDARLHERIVQGIDLTLEQRYPDARSVFRSIVQSWPEHPAGPLFLAAVLQAECSDYDQWLSRSVFDSLLDKAADLAERMIAHQTGDSWGYYYAGTASAYRSFAESEEGNWYAALREGIGSAGKFEEALNCDAGFTNAMSGLGTYYYWKSRKTEFLTWLPFVKDKRKEAISLLTRAADNSPYESSVALSSLMWIMIEEGRYGEALQSADRILTRYPDNRSVLWGALTAHERMRDSVALKKDVVRLLDAILKAPVRNVYGEITCRLKLAQFAVASGDVRKAAEEYSIILRYQSIKGKTHTDITKKLEAARTLNARLPEMKH